MKLTTIRVNGRPSDGTVPITDSSVLRGDGCFEVLRAYSGEAFALEEHLDRLQHSAEALDIDLPGRSDVRDWIAATARELVDGAIRVVVTRGPSIPGFEGDPIVAVFGHSWEPPSGAARLLPVEAPWHAAGVNWDLAGAKVLSYAPNLAATRRAMAAGFEDALLVATDGRILEGPTFTVAWVVDGSLETPSLDLGILDSITRRHVLALARESGIEVVEGSWGLDRLDDATEVMALSTIREVQAVAEVGDRSFSKGPVTGRLSKEFRGLIG